VRKYDVYLYRQVTGNLVVSSHTVKDDWVIVLQGLLIAEDDTSHQKPLKECITCNQVSEIPAFGRNYFLADHYVLGMLLYFFKRNSRSTFSDNPPT